MAGETVNTADLSVSNLRKFASGKINGKRKAKKKDLVDAIVDYRVGKEHQQFHGSLEIMVPEINVGFTSTEWNQYPT